MDLSVAAFCAYLAMRGAAWHLFDRGRPYIVEGKSYGPNPLASSETVRAVRTAHAIHKGQTRIDARDVGALLSAVPVRGSTLVEYGARARVQEMRGFLDVPAVAISAGFSALVAALAVHPTRPLVRLDDRYGVVISVTRAIQEADRALVKHEGKPNLHRADCANCGVSLSPGTGVRETRPRGEEYVLVTVCIKIAPCKKRVNAQARKGGAFGKRHALV